MNHYSAVSRKRYARLIALTASLTATITYMSRHDFGFIVNFILYLVTFPTLFLLAYFIVSQLLGIKFSVLDLINRDDEVTEKSITSKNFSTIVAACLSFALLGNYFISPQYHFGFFANTIRFFLFFPVLTFLLSRCLLMIFRLFR